MSDRHKTKRYIKIWLSIIVIGFVLGYSIYEMHKLIFGPKIIVDEPKNGALVSNSLLPISGRVINIKDITLNDRKIFIDENGNFKENVLLSYGYNSLSIKAVDKFGRKTEKNLEVIYK